MARQIVEKAIKSLHERKSELVWINCQYLLVSQINYTLT
jgi:hypothetical protein